jgi:hypothetical protein
MVSTGSVRRLPTSTITLNHSGVYGLYDADGRFCDLDGVVVMMQSDECASGSSNDAADAAPGAL